MEIGWAHSRRTQPIILVTGPADADIHHKLRRGSTVLLVALKCDGQCRELRPIYSTVQPDYFWLVISPLLIDNSVGYNALLPTP